MFATAGAIAVADWVAVARSIRPLEYAAKPAVMLCLIAVAVVMSPASPLERDFFIAALSLGLLSDVLLMLPRDLFVWGLAAAAVEHVAYISGFRVRPFQVGLFAVAAVIAVASSFIILPAVHRALRATKPALVTPVVVYVAVFIVMVAGAGGTGLGTAFVGALIFFYSDALLAWNRFVSPVRYGRLANMVAYHFGQALLVLSLAT